MIFPEGSTSNNSAILPYKRGAFTTRTAIQPITLLYKCHGTVMPFNEAVYDPELAVLFACNLFPTFLETTIMPPFQPNEYLFEKHREKGKEDW